MSHNFRDLERPDAAHRKDQVLMAAIGGLECLERPTRQDLVRFSRLFMPLYAGAHPDVKRTASAALSRLPRLPDDVADMLVNEPIAIAAPFIAHYPLLKESTLARAVARRGAPHARAAARRSDLSPQAIATLRSLNDPSVEGLLILRGLIPDPAKTPAAEPAPARAAAQPATATPAARAKATPAASPTTSPAAPPAAPRATPRDRTRPVVEAPPLDPSAKLRQALRALALRAPGSLPASLPTSVGALPPASQSEAPFASRSASTPQSTALPAAAPAQAARWLSRPAPTVGVRAPAQALNRPLSDRTAPAPQGAPHATPPEATPAETRATALRRVNETRLDQLARYAQPDQASWFATALADAMETSYALAERIMMDLSGRQLATALIALGAPAAISRAALESFFPHLREPSARHTLATDLIESLDRESCTARLDAWHRADRYTHGGATHVPALADTKPVRRETSDRVGRPDARRGTRKAG